MLEPQTIEELSNEMTVGKTMLFFTADWCGDCVFIKPHMKEIEETFPDFKFIKVDRDKFIDVCTQLDVFGIPSFIALDNGQELGRFVSKNRKTKEEIISFITEL